MKRIVLCGAWMGVLLLVAGHAQANLVGLWISDDYTTAGDPWVDRISSIAATPSGGGGAQTNPQPNAAGVLFDGTDDRFSVTPASNPIAGLSAFTATAIFQADGALGQGGSNRPNGFSGNFWQASHLVGIEQAGGGAGDWGVGINGAQNIVVGAGLEGDDTLIDASQSFNDGMEHIVSMVMDDVANELRLYVDGQLEGTTPVNPNTVIDEGFFFGTNGAPAAGDLAFYSGHIQEIGLDDVALSEDDVLALHAAGTFVPAAAVPEPTSVALWLLAASAGGGMLFWKRRKAA